MYFKTYYRNDFGRTTTRSETADQVDETASKQILIARLAVASARYVPGVSDNAAS